VGSEGGIHILGTGVLAEEFFALALDAGLAVEGFVENLDPAKEGAVLCGRPVLWVDRLPDGARCVCALSTAKRRGYIAQVADRARFMNLVHPSAVVLHGTTLGEGTVLSAGAIVASNTAVGRHVFVNRGARIGHHTRIGDFATVQPGANIAGLVEVGEAAYVGMGAIVIERLRVGAGATVAAGAVVIRDVPERCLVAGNPAAVRRERIDAR
jgi:sugar O-acyltransferase (sialic acid O-acetyltransferase NeuD family)